jgi:surfeit locus 1 family protein
VTLRTRRLWARLGFALLALSATALFVQLGFWQWHKGQERESEWQRFAAGAARSVPLGAGAVTSLPLYQRASVEGTLDGAHQFLLDNRSWQGRAGYEVLTPLHRAGAATLLVDRGWVPFSGARAVLPAVQLAPGAPRTLSGRLAALPSPGLALGRAAPAGEWPRVTAFPDMPQLAGALGEPLEPRILWLDAAEPDGYVRDWQAPGMSPLRHFSYAIQWWSFAGLALLVWAVMSVRAARARKEP